MSTRAMRELRDRLLALVEEWRCTARNEYAADRLEEVLLSDMSPYTVVCKECGHKIDVHSERVDYRRENDKAEHVFCSVKCLLEYHEKPDSVGRRN